MCRKKSLGQSLVEFALFFPILLLLTAGGADLARVYFVGIQMADGTRQVALQLSENPNMTQTNAALKTAIEQASSGSALGCPNENTNLTVRTVTVSDPTANGAQLETITATCSVPLLTPFLHSPVAISASAQTLLVESSQ